MFKGLFSKKNRIRKKIEKLYEQALLHQRNGRLRQYGEIMTEINRLELSLDNDENSAVK